MDLNSVQTNLDDLTNKYKSLNKQTTNSYDDLIKSKDAQIMILTAKIKKLEQQLIDIALIYNEKIEEQKTQHKKDMMIMNKQFRETNNH